MDRRPGPLSLEDGNLLTKRENLKGNIGSAAKEDANHGEDGEYATRHEISVTTGGKSSRVPIGAETQITDFADLFGFVYPQPGERNEVPVRAGRVHSDNH